MATGQELPDYYRVVGRRRLKKRFTLQTGRVVGDWIRDGLRAWQEHDAPAGGRIGA
jgi:hypothetical protein